MKTNKFELKADGAVERVGPFGSYGPTVEANTKSEAVNKFLTFAFRALEHSPQVKIRNGAYQLAYESLSGVNVEAGRENRNHAICISVVANWTAVKEETASFEYYASEQYVNAI